MISIKVPAIGESITEVVLLKWLKKEGDYVKRDEIIAEMESEKATFDLHADQAGVLLIKVQEGETLQIGAIVADIDEGAKMPAVDEVNTIVDEADDGLPQSQINHSSITQDSSAMEQVKITPLASVIMKKENLRPEMMSPPLHKIQKNDILKFLQQENSKDRSLDRVVKKEKMSSLRKVISRRLVEAKNTTAMLTTFNEVDMSRIMEIRKQYKEAFKKQHDVNLGFMSFFVKACCIALEEWPIVNAAIDGESIAYHHYADISIAVSSPKGLVVPVIRNAELLSMAEIEKSVLSLATKARENKLTMEEMTGGTFTITNGGVFGSLMSTPIINLPQVAILGMHKIQERPVVLNGQVLVRPMMYVALSYDHRIIDGRESVSFLVRVKELLETPSLLLIRKNPMNYLLNLI